MTAMMEHPALFYLVALFDMLLLVSLLCGGAQLVRLLLALAVYRTRFAATTPLGAGFVLAAALLAYPTPLAAGLRAGAGQLLLDLGATSEGIGVALALAAAAWLLGALALLCRHLVRRRRLRRALRMTPPGGGDAAFAWAAMRCPPPRGLRRVTLPGLSCPGVYGARQPVLALPAGFAESYSEEQRRLLYLHELAHLRRCDTLLFPLLDVLAACLWPFRPLVRELARLRQTREIACDRQALRLAAGQALPYAQLLLHSARLAGGLPVSFAGRGRGQLRHRLWALLQPAGCAKRRVAALCAALAVLCTLAALCQPPAAQRQLMVEYSDASVQAFPLADAEESEAEAARLLARQQAQGQPVYRAALVLRREALWGLVGTYEYSIAEAL